MMLSLSVDDQLIVNWWPDVFLCALTRFLFIFLSSFIIALTDCNHDLIGNWLMQSDEHKVMKMMRDVMVAKYSFKKSSKSCYNKAIFSFLSFEIVICQSC